MTEKLWGVCYGRGGVHAHLCISRVLTLKSPIEWKIEVIKVWKCLVSSWQRVSSEEQMCWQLLGQDFGTSKVSRALWWSVSTVWLSNAKASRDTGNHTQFSKAKGQKQRSTARGQAVWVLCEVNVHIHIMYRHHDHLQSWVSGFQKVLDNKDVLFVSASESSILLLFWVKEILALKWSCGVEGVFPPQLLFSCPVFQHSVCLWNASTALCGCRVERRGIVENEDRGW